MLNVQKQQAKILCDDIKKSTREWLDGKTIEEIKRDGGSIEFVNQNIQSNHCELLLWCHRNRGVVIDIYNAHAVIDQYEPMEKLFGQIMRQKTGTEVISAFKPEYKGQIMPEDFAAYFAVKNEWGSIQGSALNRKQRRAKK